MRHALNPPAIRSDQGGFTLVEMSMVLVIVGLLIAGWIRYGLLYSKNKDILKARENVALLVNDIDSFRQSRPTSNQLYPCPARLDLPRTDPNFGRAFNLSCNVTAAPFNLNPNTLSAASPLQCANGICIAVGARDLSGAGREAVLIGAVPIRDLADIDSDIQTRSARGIGSQITRSSEQGYEADSIDPWGNQYLYAVTLSMTQSGQFKFYEGVIALQDEFGNATAGIQDNAHYVVVSHGPNRRGGFSALTGVNDVPCGTVATGRDNENCNSDGIFVRALGNYEANGAWYYDDIVRARGPMPGLIWTDIKDPVSGALLGIRNLNTGNVGIGTGTPTAQLDVGGTLRATKLPSSPKPGIQSSLICDANGSLCFPIKSITSAAGISCAPGEIMKGLKIPTGSPPGTQIEPICAPGFSPLLPNQSCPAGPPRQWIVGIKSNGAFICAP